MLRVDTSSMPERNVRFAVPKSEEFNNEYDEYNESNKSLGVDGIPPNLFKETLEQIKVLLERVFNMPLRDKRAVSE